MIFIDEYSEGFLSVQFKPTSENLKRMRAIPGARFDGEKKWIFPAGVLGDFEDAFKGEYIWLTPRHLVTGDPPPPPPKLYGQIPKHAIQLDKGTPYNYQLFGANFLVYTAKKEGHAFLTDKVGTGRLLQNVI